ncbi:uncharacterized protein LOC143534390 [Bidens hawaiensis]|uniref:uncharacterized protein LOC143533854 n=1 Tax=Bidens hawaiensis TaxID=980011 RepID=UPI0040496F00
MEPFDFVHNFKAQKANALARYKLFTNITKAVQLIEAFVAVALISWSSTRLPLVFKFSGEYLLALASYLMNQHVVFLVGNVIVFVCYLLSRYSDSGNESSSLGIQYDNSKDETVPDIPKVKLVPLQLTEPPMEKTKIEPEPEVAAVTAIKQAAKQIERFQRTQSDLKSKISVKHQPELRRSATERRKSKAVASGELEPTIYSFPAVDKLSNEEFRIAVEAFILKQQRFLKQQSMVIDGS